MATSQRTPIDTQPKLCDHILSDIAKSNVSLRIGRSLIPNAGSGLFAVNDIPAGSEIFRSNPLIMVAESAHQGICDFCFLNSRSSVHSDGRFYTSNEENLRPQVTPCSACRVARYCSKNCQVKAWKSYHKYECTILQENPALKSLDQALCRLLIWVKKGVISEDNMRAVVALETGFETKMERLRQASDDAPEIDQSLQAAQNAHSAVEPGISLNFVRQLYCTASETETQISTHALAVCPSELEASYGICLDLVVSLINHCCDENAHVFFEGRELRCRALKNISAGMEITVCYRGGRQDVLQRRRILKEQFFFTCDCNKCKTEIAEHVTAAAKRQDHLGILRKAQDTLTELEFKYTLAFYSSARFLKTAMDYQERLLDIEQKVYQDGNWPDHIEPMPSALRALGCMYLELNYVVGLEFVLKGTLYSREHAGPRWVLDLMGLVKFLIFLSQERDESLNWTGCGHPEVLGGRLALQNVARGYLILVCLSGRFTFGFDTKYVRALFNWAGNITERSGDHSIDTEAFEQLFKKSQDKLLTWAKMKTSRGLELPSRETTTALREDIAEFNAKVQVKAEK